MPFHIDDLDPPNETVVPKNRPLAPVQFVEPKSTITPPQDGAPATTRMETRDPLSFDAEGNKQAHHDYHLGEIAKEVAKAVGGTVAGFDPGAMASGGESNALGATLDTLYNPIDSLYSNVTGKPYRSQTGFTDQISELATNTPDWVKQAGEFFMGGAPKGLGGHLMEEAPGRSSGSPVPILPERMPTEPVLREPTTSQHTDVVPRETTRQQGQVAQQQQSSGRPPVPDAAREIQEGQRADANRRNPSPRQFSLDDLEEPRMETPSQQQQAFVGKSGGADVRDTISRAQQLEKDGHSPEEIWKQTSDTNRGSELVGAFKDTDGHWKVELHDGRLAASDGVAEFPHIRERYPDMVNEATVSAGPHVEVGRGHYNADDRELNVATPKEGDAPGVLSHELQHGIQTQEGWPFGSSVGFETREKLIEFLKEHGRAPTQEERLRMHLGAFDTYEKGSGEVEARHAQSRVGMSWDERAAHPPTPEGSLAQVPKDRYVSRTAPELQEATKGQQGRLEGAIDEATKKVRAASEAYDESDKQPPTKALETLAHHPEQPKSVPDVPKGRISYTGARTVSQPQQSRHNAGGSQPPRGPRGGRGPKPPFLNPPPLTGNRLERIGREIMKVVSPTGLSEASRAAERLIRAVEGKGRQLTAAASHALDKFRKDVFKLSEPDRLDLIHYIQTDGKEGKLAHPKFQAVVDELKRINRAMIKEIERLNPESFTDFMENYLPQLWTKHVDSNPRSVITASTFFKEKKIPTYRDGIAMGLKPVTTDPIEMLNRYMASMRKYLDVKSIVQQGREANYIQLADSRRPRPANTRTLNMQGRTHYANEDFARVFNNYVSKGFRQSAEVGGLYNGLLRASNATTAMQLGLSAFHVSTMVKESYIAAIGDALKDMSKGKVPSAEKFKNSIAAPYSFYKKGDELIRAYLGDPSATPDVNRLADLAARSNMRVGELDEVYRATAMGNYWKSIRDGMIGDELQQAKRDFGERPVSTPFLVAGKLIETTAQPIFYHYIPRLKSGVFMERMGDYLRENPTASMADQVSHAQRIADVIDDQFGELVQNNIFWDNHLKQTANLLLTSTGWTLGTLRLFGQGTADIAKLTRDTIKTGEAQPLTDRAAYMLASIVGIMAMGQVYQGLRSVLNTILGPAQTGMESPPFPGTIKDSFVPRTGAQTDSGDDERVVLPGYDKDIMGWWHHPIDEAYNKLAPLPKTILDVLSNKDYRGDPIVNHGDPILTQLYDYGKRIIGGNLPISAGAFSPPSEKTGTTAAERFMGIRPAGGWITNPERDAELTQNREGKAKRQKQIHEMRDAARKGKQFSLDDLDGGDETPSFVGKSIQRQFSLDDLQ